MWEGGASSTSAHAFSIVIRQLVERGEREVFQRDRRTGATSDSPAPKPTSEGHGHSHSPGSLQDVLGVLQDALPLFGSSLPLPRNSLLCGPFLPAQSTASCSCQKELPLHRLIVLKFLDLSFHCSDSFSNFYFYTQLKDQIMGPAFIEIQVEKVAWIFVYLSI